MMSSHRNPFVVLAVLLSAVALLSVWRAASHMQTSLVTPPHPQPQHALDAIQVDGAGDGDSVGDDSQTARPDSAAPAASAMVDGQLEAFGAAALRVELDRHVVKRLRMDQAQLFAAHHAWQQQQERSLQHEELMRQQRDLIASLQELVQRQQLTSQAMHMQQAHLRVTEQSILAAALRLRDGLEALQSQLRLKQLRHADAALVAGDATGGAAPQEKLSAPVSSVSMAGAGSDVTAKSVLDEANDAVRDIAARVHSLLASGERAGLCNM